MYRSTRVTLVLASPYHITYPEGPSIKYVFTFLDGFETIHYVYQHKYSTERRQKWPFSKPIYPVLFLT